MERKTRAIWVSEATLRRFNKRKKELKYRNADVTVDYLLKVEKEVKNG